jgi:hypothetical protein
MAISIGKFFLVKYQHHSTLQSDIKIEKQTQNKDPWNGSVFLKEMTQPRLNMPRERDFNHTSL